VIEQKQIGERQATMHKDIDLEEINKKISLIKRETEALKRMADTFPALSRNTSRILASLKMLEINVPYPVDPELQD